MSSPHAVCLIGFSEFERRALATHFKLTIGRAPAYQLVEHSAGARFLIVDGDSRGATEQVAYERRIADSIYIGGHAPEAALARLPRPIDPRQLLRELDASLLMQLHPVAGAGLPAGGDDAKDDAPRTQPGALVSPSQLAELADLFPDRQADAAKARPADPGPDALLVDDSEIALRYLKMRLAELGVRSHAVRDSDSALEQLRTHAYALVFVDVDLGEASSLDGLALCQQIKRRGGKPPIVAIVSAHASATDRVRGSLAGCDAYLGKPLVAAELASVVAKLRKPAAAS